MSDIDLEKYYQKGGTYVIPVEIMNQIIGEKEDLIKHLENKKEQSHKQEIICRKRRVPKLYEIGICLGEQYAYQDILEKVKSGKYE